MAEGIWGARHPPALFVLSRGRRGQGQAPILCCSRSAPPLPSSDALPQCPHCLSWVTGTRMAPPPSL